MIVAVVFAVGGLQSAPAHAVEGLKVDAKTVYRLVPRKGKVHVRVQARLVNTMPAQRRGAYISTPYFDSFAVPVLGPAKNVRARSSRGGSLSTSVEKGKLGISGIIVDLEPNLVHGAPQTVTIEFDLPSQPPRSESVTRVNKGFASWFVFGSGDAGDIDVRIEVPADFEVSFSKAVRADFIRLGKFNIYEMKNVRRLDDSVLFASALNEDGIRGERFSVAGANVRIKAWPNDAKWERFATRLTRRGLPVLRKLIGVPPPNEDIAVVESSRAYQLGYAGFYNPAEGRVEVGDVLDEPTVLHELSHVWINRRLFTDRWVGEGLAEAMANRALDELGEKSAEPKPVRLGAAGSVKLNAWPLPAPLDPERAKVEAYAYNASYAVVE